jgi:hypothetical protein
MVVDHHRRGDRRQEPADDRLGPCLAIEARVLLEVAHLVARSLRRPLLALVDELLGLDRHLIGVHLVAAQEEKVRVVGRFRLQDRERQGV